ncbi:MAG TPA: metallophosphoesterase [Aquabacterium sp.]|uniref:metallophosphoesterase n=1 Tax=Aquabacterium sp. TaxID=1872578 RepID=UPI002D94552C|nr:metallophosphoesterase [Aquabacterium sp.]HET6787192.1 metallophosphoesterase [Aquabacterium sp.]HEX5372446.1 metallophosphoesterase [Aquabacterium sp.]
MRIQIFSDLHLERYPDFQPQVGEGVDVLVLAGDIGSYQAGSLLRDEDFGLARFSPLGDGARWPRVLFLPGNHEFDGLEFEPACARLKATCERLGITWLDREVVTLGDVRFVGTTLWSDFEALASAESSTTRQMQARDKAFRAANYYLRKNTTLLNGEPVLAEAMRDMALDCQAWLREALTRPFEGSTVAVTHFAPSLRSADPRYGLTPGTAGFCNALDDLLPYAQLWIHGHLHCNNDYTVSGEVEGRPYACRVVANPLGYRSKGEQDTFLKTFVIDLPSRPALG